MFTNPLNRELELRIRARYANMLRNADEQQISPTIDEGTLNELEQLTQLTPSVPAPEQVDTPLRSVYNRFRHLAKELSNRHLTDNQLQDAEVVKSWFKVTDGIATQVMEELKELEAAIHSSSPPDSPQPVED